MISDGDALLFLDLISEHTRNMVSTSLKKKKNSFYPFH